MMTITEVLEGVMSATTIEKKAVCAPRALNEAYDYDRPSSFSRALRLEFGNVVVLLISGTAAHRRFPGAASSHLRQHHGLAGSRGSHLERRSAHHLLPAGHRTRLRSLQPGADGFLSGAGSGSAAGVDGDPGDSLPAGAADRDRRNCRLPQRGNRGVGIGRWQAKPPAPPMQANE